MKNLLKLKNKNFNIELFFKINQEFINPLTSPGEEVSVFTSPYLSAGAPSLGEAKGLIINILALLFFLKKYYRISRSHPRLICHPLIPKIGCEDFICHPRILKILQYNKSLYI